MVTTGPSDGLIPFAAEQQGTKFVVFPALFAKVTCKIALAEFLINEGAQPEPFDQAAEAAAKCLDAGGSQRTCFVGFADELARRYGKAFAGLSADVKETAFGIHKATLYQIMMHEYAHHFLDHLARIRAQKVARVDAEFEADLFAVMNGILAAEPASAMFYFFNGISEIEGSAKKFTTPDYESGSCRASNVGNITAFVGIAPLLIVDAAGGGGYTLRRNSASQMRSVIGEQFAKGKPALAPGSCGRVARVALGDALEELKQLYTRVEKDLDFLFSKQKELDTARANRLLADLAEMSKQFRYMDGLAAKSLAAMLRGWGIRGQSRKLLLGQVDRLLDTKAVTDSFLSEDFGILLQVQGVTTLQERVDLTAQSRMDRSFLLLQRSVSYNPALSDAWMNLAFIAFKRGDCAAAAQFADRAAQTSTVEDQRKSTEFFVSKMRELSPDPEACRAQGIKFHPYPGL
ncbi:MAG: hypothetical protein ABIN58_03405 [candidate division WOR-3 bacterium]